MTRQPEWKFVANLGDSNPLEHGGYFIFVDTTGVYPAEAEWYDPDKCTAHRIVLDRMELVNGWLTPFRIANRKSDDRPLPFPIESYREWFDEYLRSPSLREAMCSEDPIQRAFVYRELYKAQGWENGDGYPLVLSKEEAEERYREYIK